MKTLHLSNVANVAYGYCKILAGAGEQVSLRCHDLHHVMSQPEWDDLELDASAFPNENDFRENTVDLGDYCRPEWFVSETVKGPVARVEEKHPRAIARLRRMLSPRARRALVRAYLAADGARRRVSGVLGRRAGSVDADDWDEGKDIAQAVVAESLRHGERFRISRADVAQYLAHANWVAGHAPGHDVVFAYAGAPVYAMLHGRLPYVAVEIGTMRELPFDGSALGRLLAAAYRRADFVLITNPDVRAQAEVLGLQRYAFCPHPLDEDVYAPCPDTAFAGDLRARYGARKLIFAPARQNWDLKGNDRYFRAFARVLRDGEDAVLLVPGWGQEVERSKELAASLGIASRVAWLPPQSERTMVKYYSAVDLVLDQFKLGVFGLITPKGLACGAPVLTSYDPAVHRWCFAEHPPVVACSAEDEIYEALRSYLRNGAMRRERGALGRKWVLAHHSRAVITRALRDAMSAARGHYEAARDVRA